MKFNGLLCTVCSIICAVFIGSSDAAVTAWTEPTIATPSGSGTYTKGEDETTIATLQCSSSGTEMYAISEQPASALLTIDDASGEVTVATGKTLDFETEPTYIFKVTCTDADNAGTATITLTVTNVNEAPDFSQEQYSLTVPDGTEAGYSLVTVTVTDQEGDTITTALAATGNSAGHWTLDGNTVKVAASQTLNQATLGGYSLQVEADDGSSTSTATLWVVIKTCSSATAAAAGGLAMVVTVAMSFFL